MPITRAEAEERMARGETVYRGVDREHATDFWYAGGETQGPRAHWIQAMRRVDSLTITTGYGDPGWSELRDPLCPSLCRLCGGPFRPTEHVCGVEVVERRVEFHCPGCARGSVGWPFPAVVVEPVACSLCGKPMEWSRVEYRGYERARLAP